jgi:hypothetical protein
MSSTSRSHSHNLAVSSFSLSHLKLTSKTARFKLADFKFIDATIGVSIPPLGRSQPELENGDT